MQTCNRRLVYDMPSSEYHELDALSSTQIRHLPDDPETYYAKYVKRSMRDANREAFVLGEICHAGVLEPHLIEENYVFLDPKDLKNPKTGEPFETLNKNYNVVKAYLAEKEEEARMHGKALIEPKIKDQYEAMMTSYKHNKEAQRWLDGCTFETTVLWDTEDGTPCRARVDALNLEGNESTGNRPLLLDYKTTSKYDSFLSDGFKRYGYGRQAAWYWWGLGYINESSWTIPDPATVFLVQDKQWPWRITPYLIQPDVVLFYHWENMLALDDLKDRMERGDWTHWGSRKPVIVDKVI